MNLVEALRTGKNLRRPLAKFLGSNGDGWMGNAFIRTLLLEQGYGLMWPGSAFSRPSYLLNEEDLLADDWEIQE